MPSDADIRYTREIFRIKEIVEEAREGDLLAQSLAHLVAAQELATTFSPHANYQGTPAWLTLAQLHAQIGHALAALAQTTKGNPRF